MGLVPGDRLGTGLFAVGVFWVQSVWRRSLESKGRVKQILDRVHNRYKTEEEMNALPLVLGPESEE